MCQELSQEWTNPDCLEDLVYREPTPIGVI